MKIKNIFKYTGSKFDKQFRNPTVKITKKPKIQFVTLSKWMLAKEILETYKPEKVDLDYVASVVKAGLLDKTGCFTTFARDKNGVLWSVGVRWNDDGWSVGADSVDSSYGWNGGYQVFSRRFFDTSVSDTKTLNPSDTLPNTLEINGVRYKKV